MRQCPPCSNVWSSALACGREACRALYTLLHGWAQCGHWTYLDWDYLVLLDSWWRIDPLGGLIWTVRLTQRRMKNKFWPGHFLIHFDDYFYFLCIWKFEILKLKDYLRSFETRENKKILNEQLAFLMVIIFTLTNITMNSRGDVHPHISMGWITSIKHHFKVCKYW